MGVGDVHQFINVASEFHDRDGFGNQLCSLGMSQGKGYRLLVVFQGVPGTQI